jgi:hypothetical protein
MIENNELLDKQEKSKPARDKLGRLLPGNSGNLNGRPKGISITGRIREIFENEPEKFEGVVKDYMKNPKHRDLMWRMIDGNPRQPIEHSGEINLPTPIYGGKSKV